MANLSNINNKFLVTTGGNVLIGQTSVVGSSRFQVTGNSTFAGNVISLDTFYLQNSSGKRWQQLFDGNKWNLRYYNGSSWSADALEIDISNNATFAGNVTTNTGILDLNIGTTNIGIEVKSTDAGSYIRFDDGVNANRWYLGVENGNFGIYNNANERPFKIDSSKNATFAGSVRAEDRLDLYNGTKVLQLKNVNNEFTIRNGNSGLIPLTIESSGNTTFAGNTTINGILTANAGSTSTHTLTNTTSNGTVLQLTSTGDNRTLTLQTDHIYSNGTLYFGDNSYQSRFRGSSFTFENGNATFGGNIFLEGNNSHIAFNTSASSGHPKISMGSDADFSFLNTAGSNIFHIENGGNIGIGTSSPGHKLEVNGETYINGRDIGKAVNYASAQGWVAADPTSNQTGFYGGVFGPNGGPTENKVYWDYNYAGQRALIWRSQNNDTASGADGGWNKQMYVASNNLGYMSIVYVKRNSSSTNGSFYHGCDGSNTLYLTGTANTNPYFCNFNVGDLPQDVWCISIGFIQANNDSNTANNPIGGVYRLDTGVKLKSASTFKMGTDSSIRQSHRTYLYYSTNINQNLSWSDPGFYALDGSQPSISDLFGAGVPTAGGSSPWTTSGNDIYNNNSGSVGINNTSPSSHYGNYNQLVVGDGTGNQGMTIFAGSNDESTINFTDTTSTYNNNFNIAVDHSDSSESNNPSFQINFENNRYVTINRQTVGSSQVPQVRLGMFNSSSLPANLDHSMLEIGINGGMNNPGMVMYGDSQGNSNPFIGMVSTSGSSQITTKFFRFYHNTTLCGTIQKRYNANEVQYLTTSDYRLKEDLKPFKALDTICKINVYNYKWNDIEEDNVNYGVLAHELQELIPEVVAGEKDEVNEKGEKEYQAVDYSKLVPHLIQSIQELKAEIDELKK